MNFICQSKLFKQLIAVISLLIILAIGIPGAFTWFYTTPNVVEERYHNVMIDDVGFLATRLDWLLTKSLEDVEYLSKKIELSDPTKLGEAGKVLDIFIRSSAIFTGGIATDQHGIMQLFYSTPQGIIELKQKNDMSNRDYIQYPLAKNQSYFSDVIITHSNPSPVIFVSSTLLEHGQTSGVLAMSINLWNENNIFRSLVNDFQEKKQGNIYVVDGQGTIVFHKDKERVGQTINSSILAQIANNKEGMAYNISSEKRNVDVAFSQLKRNNWVVVYEMDHEEIYAMSDNGRFMAVCTMVIVLMLGLLASGIFARIILKPFEEITNATEQVAAGDLTLQINYKGHDDFRGVIKNFNIMTTNLRSQYDELEKLSMHDYLTGLANRRYFEQQFQLELERACRIGHSSTILMLDIDDFKVINDKFGHLEGDRALRLVASAIKEIVREVDLPVRFGGEEFLVLLPETSLEQGQIVAEKIRNRISKINIASRKGNITVTVSIGMAGTEQEGNYRGAPLDRVKDEILKRADEALYKAKGNGKNKVVVWGFPIDPT
jgi:diguanylate cyclase (GGDEF)-like protein